MTKFNYSERKEDLTDAFVRVVYNDGSSCSPLSKNYDGLKRTDMKSATIVSTSGKNLYTLPIKNNKLIYRKRNLANAFGDAGFPLEQPKRAIILATEGKIIFWWDSKEIKELNKWGNEEPYTCPKLREDEK